MNRCHTTSFASVFFIGCFLAVNAAAGFAEAASREAGDWPFWRGPEYNGISRETGLVERWNPKGGPGSNIRWMREELGSRSTPIVLGDKLYTIVGTEAGEKIVCVNAATGENIWENEFNVWLSDVPKERVGWSSVVGDPETGNVYALGVCGYFQCMDGQTGESLWSVPMHEQFGLLSTYGGRTNFPVIFDDMVIVSAIVIGWGEMAKPAHRFIAFDKLTGDVVWFKGTRLLPYDTTYSSPNLTVLNGQKSMVFGSGDGAVWAMQPRTGLPIWNFQLSRRGLNISPVVVGNRVYSGHSEENTTGNAMGAIVALDGTGHGNITDSHELWSRRELMMGKSSPLVVDEQMFCFDDRAKLHVLNTETGDLVGKKQRIGTMMRASPLYADGKIYAFSANGRWQILRPDDKRGVKVLQKGKLPAGQECHGSPICAQGRIYVPTTHMLYCLEDPEQEHGRTPIPEAAEEVSANDNPQATHVQIVPAEILMMPGKERQFAVRLFNSHGQLLPVTSAEFSLEGPGEISASGLYTAPSVAEHVAVTVRAQVDGIEGQARIRVVPSLPWKFDFENVAINPRTQTGEPSITWVGARYRHAIRRESENQFMVKVTTIPKGTRSRCWFGHPHMHDYTIQADVRGAIKNNKMPDIGIIAQGYTLDLHGAHQRLQIRTWGTQLRMASEVKFPWKPETWYTMKFRAALENDQAVLKAKIWPKDQAEPENWILEATDPFPNRSGSPGLFGNAKDAELYLDNIVVFDNAKGLSENSKSTQ